MDNPICVNFLHTPRLDNNRDLAKPSQSQSYAFNL